MLEFNLPTNDIPLSTIFQALQVAQSILTLQDYSVSQTTLDQVFVSFASQQVNDYDSETSKSKSSVSKSVTSEPSKTQKTRSSFSMRHCTKNSFKRHASILVSLCRENKRAKSPKSKELPDKKQPTPKRSGASVDSVVRNTQMRRASNHNQLISNLLLSASPKVVKSKTLMAARHKIHAKAAWPKNHSFGEYLSSGGYPVVGGNKAAPPKLKTSGVVGDIRDRQTMVSYLAAPSQHYHHGSSGYRAPHPHVQQGAASSSTHGGSYARVAKLNTTSRAIVPTRHHYQQHLNQQHHHHQHHHQQNHQHHPHHHQSTTALAKPKTYHPRQMKP